MARYSNKAKSGTEVAFEKAQDVDAEYIRSGEDVFAALVSPMRGCLALALLSPDQFVLEDGEKSSKVSVPRFTSKARVSGKIITDVKVSEKEISWLSSSRSTHILELFAEDATLLNPCIRLKIDDSSGEEKAELYVDIDTANKLLDKMVLQYREKAGKGSKTVLPAPKGAPLPYRSKGKDVLFADVPSAQIMSSSSARAEQRAKNAILTCSVPGCGQKHPIKNMRHHVSWHQIHDKHLSSKVKAGVGPMELCGMCGCHPALTYTKSGAANGCPTWLVKNKKALIWHYECKCHPFDKISYKSAKKSNKQSPSTNVPIKCPECSTGTSIGSRNTTDQHYYKYAFQIHWNECHSNLSMPADLAESIVISQEEKTWLQSFALPKTTRSKPRKNPASHMSGTSSIVDAMSSVGDSVGDEDGIGSRPSSSPYFLLQPIAEEDAETAKAAFASAQAFLDTRPCPNDAALAARDADFGYSFEGLAVGTRALASLHDARFINDEVAECLRLNSNVRTAELANSGALDYKCCIISSFFATHLVGLTVPKSQSTRRARMLGFADNEVPFSKELRESYEDSLHRRPRKWADEIFGTPFAREECPSVFEAGWDGLLFQVNLSEYHWFFIHVDFAKKTITAEDSTPIIDGRVDIGHTENRVIELLEDNTLGELDVVTLRNACAKLGLPRGGDKASSLYTLMRPMFLQEVFHWLTKQGRRTMPDACEVLASEWNLMISSDMPKQGGFNNCCLFMSHGCDVVSSGKSLKTISAADVAKLESSGRSLVGRLMMEDNTSTDEDKTAGTDLS